MAGAFKKCFKCGLLLPISMFYAHREMADGHLNKCKNCTKTDVHKNYIKNIENKEYVEKERIRGREKYKRLNYGTLGVGWRFCSFLPPQSRGSIPRVPRTNARNNADD